MPMPPFARTGPYLADLVSGRGVGCYTLSPEGEIIEADFVGLWERDLVEDLLLRFDQLYGTQYSLIDRAVKSAANRHVFADA